VLVLVLVLVLFLEPLPFSLRVVLLRCCSC
jgi:hypothetical protein